MKRFLIILMALALGLSVSAQQTCPDNNHPHAIDLGLPSGTKWACCNVGATSPEQYGSYVAWGETKSKTDYSWNSYQWGSGKGQTTKYCNNSSFGKDGFTDSKTTLEVADDAARSNWGRQWHTPTSADFQELIENTTSEWIDGGDGKGVSGRIFKSSNGKSLFFPAAGYRNGTSLHEANLCGDYWSKSLNIGTPNRASTLYFNSEDVDVYYYSNRGHGHVIRPVHR